MQRWVRRSRRLGKHRQQKESNSGGGGSRRRRRRRDNDTMLAAGCRRQQQQQQWRSQYHTREVFVRERERELACLELELPQLCFGCPETAARAAHTMCVSFWRQHCDYLCLLVRLLSRLPLLFCCCPSELAISLAPCLKANAWHQWRCTSYKQQKFRFAWRRWLLIQQTSRHEERQISLFFKSFFPFFQLLSRLLSVSHALYLVIKKLHKFRQRMFRWSDN